MDNFITPVLFEDVVWTENEKLALCLEVANHNLVRYDSSDAISGQRRWYFECTQALRGDIAMYQEEQLLIDAHGAWDLFERHFNHIRDVGRVTSGQ